jgi:uncharacterized protein
MASRGFEMKISEMNRQECRDSLARMGFGRLGCAYRNQPYVVPIYFAYNTNHLYGFSAMGQKIKWMRSNPLVCLEADEVRHHDDWTTVVAQGRYEEILDTPKYASLRSAVQASLQKRTMWWQTGFAAAKSRRQFKPQIPVFFSIRIKQITGLRASPDPAPVYIG